MTREEAHLFHNDECNYDGVDYSAVENRINKIFDEHETEIKGLKQIIQNQSDLLEMYSVDNEVPNNAYLVKQLKVKDEKINRLSNRLKLSKQLIDTDEKIIEEKNEEIAKLKAEYKKTIGGLGGLIAENMREAKKARSIVAMLWWEWREWDRRFKEEYKNDRTKISCHTACILSCKYKKTFNKAYKMLKGSKCL